MWSQGDLKQALRAETGFEEPVLRAPIEVAKGNTPVLAMSRRQGYAFQNFFGIDLNAKIPFYVLIETVGPEPTRAEALIKKTDIKPTTDDHLIVSRGLAAQLGLDPQQGIEDIRVLEVYQKIKDINLDEV